MCIQDLCKSALLGGEAHQYWHLWSLSQMHHQQYETALAQQIKCRALGLIAVGPGYTPSTTSRTFCTRGPLQATHFGRLPLILTPLGPFRTGSAICKDITHRG